jgi:hypothetical protein
VPATERLLAVKNPRNKKMSIYGDLFTAFFVKRFGGARDTVYEFYTRRKSFLTLFLVRIFLSFFVSAKVARWYIFKPKIPIWVKFGGS